MRIHLISDIHLDHGPYVVPEGLDFDVLVVAGDIDEIPERGVEFLKTAARGKPCVFVLGNHDYWHDCPKSFFNRAPEHPIPFTEKLAQWRAAAEGVENLHLLENEAVVLGNTRFLGCTLWTSYANGSIDQMQIAQSMMQDRLYIGSGNWFDEHPGAIEEFIERAHDSRDKALMLQNFQDSYRSRFHALIAADLHKQSAAYLRQQLREEGDWEQTVVVTHHAPSWEVLTAGGLVSKPLKTLASLDFMAFVDGKTSGFSRMDRDESGIMRLGFYASPMDEFLKHECKNVLWMHGHTHAHTDIAVGQCRVVCNPRGYARGEEYGNDGSSWGFDERFIVDTADGVMPFLNTRIDRAIALLQAHAVELKALRSHVNHRNTAIRDSVRERAERYGELVSELFQETVDGIYDATGAGNFHLPGKALDLPGVEWKARFPQPIYFPSPQPKMDRCKEWEEEFPSLFADGPKDGGIGAMLGEIRAFIRDLERVRTWREMLPAGQRKALKPVMALLKSIGADPENVGSKYYLNEIRIEVNPGFADFDFRPLQQLGFRFWLVGREEGPGPTMSTDEVNEMARKRAEELGLNKSWR